jgi:uncharacterized membrane protein
MGIPTSGERGAAALVYGLLLAAPFTFGVLAWIGLIIALVRKNSADEVARSHYRHQLRAFSDDAIVLVVSVIVGWAALAGGIGSALGIAGVPLPFGLDARELGAWTIGLAVMWLALWLYGFIGLIVGSLRGLLRLARGQAI